MTDIGETIGKLNNASERVLADLIQISGAVNFAANVDDLRSAAEGTTDEGLKGALTVLAEMAVAFSTIPDYLPGAMGAVEAAQSYAQRWKLQ